MKLLTDERIDFIAKKVAEECGKSPDSLTIRELKTAIKEADDAIDNIPLDDIETAFEGDSDTCSSMKNTFHQ